MILVTGAAGFIGTNLLKGLNQLGYKEIVAVDDLTNGYKFTNLSAVTISDYLDKDHFRQQLSSQYLKNLNIEVIYHQGACSETTQWDGKFMMDNNFEFSKELFMASQEARIPFIYASSAAVYGGKNSFEESQTQLRPLNVYGYSKLLFDDYVQKTALQSPVLQSPVYGLRYFNVYGPYETYKGSMASVPYHLFQQYQKRETIKLFGAYDGYQAGEQKRDFIFVDDVVRVNIWFFSKLPQSGIYNCGTGTAKSFNNIAAVFTSRYDDAELQFIEFPEHLKDSYQSFTQADLTKLRSIGYDAEFISVEQGVSLYLDFLDH